MHVNARENENSFQLGVNDHSKTIIGTFQAPLGCLLATRVFSTLSYSCQDKIWQKESLIRS